MIYLDYQATTPLAPEVAVAMQAWIEDKFANPHSPSRWGSEAAAAIRNAIQLDSLPRVRLCLPFLASSPLVHPSF